MCSATICFVGPGPAESGSPVSETGGSIISRITDESSETMTVDPVEWRTPHGTLF
jgi:hypothetical protein